MNDIDTIINIIDDEIIQADKLKKLVKKPTIRHLTLCEGRLRALIKLKERLLKERSLINDNQ